MVPAAALPGQELAREPIRIRSLFQKAAAYGWEGRGTTATYVLEEGKSMEQAKGQRKTATEGCHEGGWVDGGVKD